MSTARLLFPWARVSECRRTSLRNTFPVNVCNSHATPTLFRAVAPFLALLLEAPRATRRDGPVAVRLLGGEGGRRRGDGRGEVGGSLSSPHPRLPLLPGQLEEKGFGRTPPTSTETASRCLLPSQLERSLAHARANEMRSGSEWRSRRFEQRH